MQTTNVGRCYNRIIIERWIDNIYIYTTMSISTIYTFTSRTMDLINKRNYFAFLSRKLNIFSLKRPTKWAIERIIQRTLDFPFITNKIQIIFSETNFDPSDHTYKYRHTDRDIDGRTDGQTENKTITVMRGKSPPSEHVFRENQEK